MYFLDNGPKEFDEAIAPIISLVHMCPNLESLELTICDRDYLYSTWALDAFITALESWTSPNLHTFRAFGGVYWLTQFTHNGAGPLSSFFRRHPGLHTISLGLTDGLLYSERFAPDDMPVLLPSLRHLEAPALLCGPVLASSLAKQIESVTVLDEGQDNSNADLGYVSSIVAHLPRLRKLAFKGQVAYRYCPLPVEPLKTVLRAAPALEELELHQSLDRPVRFPLFLMPAS